jgi:hypothetical protein
MRRLVAISGVLGSVLFAAPALLAQQPLPPPTYQPQYQQPQYQPQYQPQPAQCPPGQVLVYPPNQAPVCQYTQPQPQYPQNYQPQQYPQQQPQVQPQPEQPRPAPPPVVYSEPEEPTHAPKWALWTGVDMGVLGYGNNFFLNPNNGGEGETTGAIAGTGMGLTLEAGARLGKRYIPYVLWEHGFLKQGRRFEGSDARSSSDYYGVGFRYIALDPDVVGILTDISIGLRSVKVTQGDQTYKMSALELFHMSLGAEIRLSTLFALSPKVMIAGGAMSDVEGNVYYSVAGKKPDNLAGPPYCSGTSGGAICPTAPGQALSNQIRNQAAYVVIGIGVGAHFDVFGK